MVKKSKNYNNMKTTYSNPNITIVLVSDNDLIATSNGDSGELEIGDGLGTSGWGARQRNPIWDDYE